MRTASIITRRGEMSILQKLTQINWGLVLLITIIASVGFSALYSAAGGSFEPWAGRQMARFAVGIVLMLAVAIIDIRLWFRFSYAFYAFALLLLVAVEVVGSIGMGAQRWLDLGVVQIQPSELMKVALILVLARYFHGLTFEQIGRPHYLIWPTLLTLVPAALIVKQPDLGSAILCVAPAGALFFLAGVRAWKFIVVIGGIGAAIPVAWQFLREYQKQRVYTFLDPENDPLGSGYHIIQSKIALGSGGIWGKGYMQGTQSHLQFLPEKQTDFIFTMFSEEMGFVGGLALLGLFLLVMIYGTAIALRARSDFGRLVASGIMTSFFIYAFINMGMVMGLLPVVGIPLPLVSYGGTAMMSLLIAFGLVINVYVHRDVHIGRRGLADER
ncbi:MAG TPA: rod shape-determining protein RodA [Alphaproteobacteria bacterium]|nr:rod shape-determining protein RodA [Alphaproteobacteria bacterium]